ncbi:sodium:solute symporter family protein [Granulicella mallensis]|uniref:SSS sodium solute transporter superfamily n=1 Tax=Granulicella mallensis (strain ATCC BAA-1857 / DSM 23137 / MP5ACTX8) TaxID=682795 RepID=G8P1V3_GRAMM|nr:sodium:solute symporter family protein [Granulicella mallensis]AEU37005.1 SSS sodium solute transporter superfamily [Granulicella mallensis MP5ACTX8]
MQAFPPNPLDLTVIGVYFAATILVGWLFRRKAHSSSDFFHAARTLPTAVTAIAFVAANCGALEIVGIVSASAKYGAKTLHFYWIGAIPAMLFLSLCMLPIYMRSRALTVPEFLKLRFNGSTRTLNIVCCGVMMILVSGISLYALAQVLRTFLGWSFTETTLSAAAIVFLYVSLGGLTATMYNEVIQFVLIVLGLLPLVFFILHDFHGMAGLTAQLEPAMRHTWVGLPVANPHAIPMDVVGVSMGLGFVLSFGYWCTDFVLIQRALAARTTAGVLNTPLVAAFVKLLFPVLVVLPGLAAAVLFRSVPGFHYDQALPALMMRYYRHGLLGFGITAILASLMSGLAGNINALTTIWTHDIYRASLSPNKSDSHYVRVGRISTLFAILLSIATAYLALSFNNIMDYLQLLFSLFNAPLLATFLLGMFTMWATPKAGFWGLLIGTLSSVVHNLAYRLHWITYGSDMSANFYGAILAFSSCLVVTALLSAFTPAKSREELADLTCWTGTHHGIQIPRAAVVLAGVALVICIFLSILFR